MSTRLAVVRLFPVVLVAGCFSPEDGRGVTSNTSFGGNETSSTATTAGSLTTTDDDSSGSGDDTMTASSTATTQSSESSVTADEGSSSVADEGSSSGAGPLCGDGNVDAGEDCDDMNDDDTDECVAGCVAASCGDGFVQSGVEPCDDGNADDTDDCLTGCVAASCGDGNVRAGVEQCDDMNANDTDACPSTCTTASCGDGFVYAGVEQCDGTPDCDGSCAFVCGNPGGGSSVAENGVGTGVLYCYEPADTVETRALKACESHFGVGTCCIIPGGYNGLQYGQCGADGGAGTYHWHPDSHPDGHCDPLYVVGDVVSPGWCGTITGNFLD